MNRRTLLGLALAAALPSVSMAGGSVDYTPGVIADALAEGQTVLVDYTTDWCTTCAAQKRVMAKLRAENPAYDEAITFVTVDWDAYADHEVSTSRNIPRRSTLLVLHGDEELARVVAQASERKVKSLLDAGLAAAAGS